MLLPVLAMGGAGQIGACIALWVRFQSNESLVRTIRGALPAGFLGVGEPLIYGVTLPLGRPFITACIGGAFGGGVVGLFDQLGHYVGAIAIGASDLSLIPLLNGSSGYGWALLRYGSGLVVAYVLGFVATMVFGVSGSVRADLEAQSTATPGDLVAPMALLDVHVTPTDCVNSARRCGEARARTGRLSSNRSDEQNRRIRGCDARIRQVVHARWLSFMIQECLAPDQQV